MRYEKAFKEKAVKLVLASKGVKSMKDIAIELNISKDTLYTWVKKAKEISIDVRLVVQIKYLSSTTFF